MGVPSVLPLWYSETALRNPVTILVTVCYPAEGWFLFSQSKIQAILASFRETTTAVVFLQDEFQS